VFDQIMAEDFQNMAPMQRSLESPAFTGVPINYQERRIWHFNEQVDRMIGVARIPEPLRMAPLLDAYVER
jgi:choline monooxygenase